MYVLLLLFDLSLCLGLCFDLLREIGYDGALSLEGEYNDPIEQMKKDIEFIKLNI